jgi:hypothetical protein
VETVAADMGEDNRRPQQEGVLPLRSVPSGAASSESSETHADPMLQQRLAELEARLEEQEAALRRVLTLLVDWVESDAEPVSYRHNAA